MSFTYEDLKRLKELFKVTGGEDNGVLPALIARLEAAELTVETWVNLMPQLENTAVYKDWRKAAGK